MPTTFTKKALSLAVYGVMAGAIPTMAMAQNAEDNSEAALEEIEVVGMKRMIQNAQELKRNADTVKDVITASDIGALPDRSVTEALQRVPGVTIEKFAASDDPKHSAEEGTTVLVRGLDRVRSEVNGRDSFSANPNGGLNFEDFPAELLGSIEVVKNQTADLISGGIAGSVNLVTRKPLDSDERLLSFGAKANYGDYREEVTPSFDGLFSDSWETDVGTFGFLVAGSHSEFQSLSDGVGLGNFHSRGNFPLPTASWDEWGTPQTTRLAGSFSGPCVPNMLNWGGCDPADVADPWTALDEAAYTPPVSPFEGGPVAGQEEGDAAVYTPAAITLNQTETDRERTGFTTSVQWESPSENTLVTVEHINSKATEEWRERVFTDGERGFFGARDGINSLSDALQWDTTDPSGTNRNFDRTFDDNGFLTSGVASLQSRNWNANFSSRWNYTENQIEDTSLNIKHQITDNLSINLDYQHIESEQLTENNGVNTGIRSGGSADGTILNASYFLDLRGDSPKVQFLNPALVNPQDQTAEQLDAAGGQPILSIASALPQISENDATADSFQFDVDYEFDEGFITKVAAGAYYSDKELTVRDTEYEGWQSLNARWDAQQAILTSPQNAPEIFDRVNWDNHFAINGGVNNFLFPAMDIVQNLDAFMVEGCESGLLEGKPAGNQVDENGNRFNLDAEGNRVNGDANGWNATSASEFPYNNCAIPQDQFLDRVEGPYAARHITKNETERGEYYVRADFGTDLSDSVNLTGNFGFRYVDYTLTSTGAQTLPAIESFSGAQQDILEERYNDLYQFATGESVFTTTEHNYTTVLPSVNLNFGLYDDFVVRLAYSEALYYPSLIDSRNRNFLTLNVTNVLRNPSLPQNNDPDDPDYNPIVDLDNREITNNASNPFLDPEKSQNLDASFEWYFSDTGSMSLALFQKDLEGIIRNQNFETVTTSSTGVTLPAQAYGPDNTGDGTINGFEISYTQFYDMLPGAWSGLGLQLNYTNISQDGVEDPNINPSEQSRFDNGQLLEPDGRNSYRQFTGLPLEGYSDESYNIIGMYEYEDLSVRLAYTWRSEYLLNLREATEFVPVYAAASGALDGSIFYSITDNVKIGLEMQNMLDEDTETKYQLNQEGTLTKGFTFNKDRRYSLSVRATF